MSKNYIFQSTYVKDGMPYSGKYPILVDDYLNCLTYSETEAGLTSEDVGAGRVAYSKNLTRLDGSGKLLVRIVSNEDGEKISLKTL